MRQAETSLKVSLLHSEAGAVQACQKALLGILPRADSAKAWLWLLALSGRNS